jgi:predicted XRE-type DNA-binding protein
MNCAAANVAQGHIGGSTFRRKKVTHAEIARRAGTSRTRVTAILNDDLEHVSSDLLIRILASLGYRVRVSVVRSDSAA